MRYQTLADTLFTVVRLRSHEQRVQVSPADTGAALCVGTAGAGGAICGGTAGAGGALFVWYRWR